MSCSSFSLWYWEELVNVAFGLVTCHRVSFILSQGGAEAGQLHPEAHRHQWAVLQLQENQDKTLIIVSKLFGYAAHINNQADQLDVKVVVRDVAWPSGPAMCSPSPEHNQSRGSHLDENRRQQEPRPPPAAPPLRSLFERTRPAFHSTRMQKPNTFTPFLLVLLIWKVDLLTCFSWDGLKASTRVCFCPGFKHLSAFRREKLPFRSKRDDLSLLIFNCQRKPVHSFNLNNSPATLG